MPDTSEGPSIVLGFIRQLPSLTPAGWLRFDSIRRGLDQAGPFTVLEVGAGEGALATWLATRYRYDGLEPDSHAYQVAMERLSRLGAGRVRQMTTGDLELTPSYDLICAFEVLEHLEHDVEELKRWLHLLRPGGYVLVSVPAHRSRFGPADEAVGHYRRYDRGDLNAVLARAGLEVLWIEAWGLGLGHMLAWIRHRLASNLQRVSMAEGTARSGRWMQPRGFPRRVMFAAVAAPFRLLQFPFRRSDLGIGWVALARSAWPAEPVSNRS